MRLLPLAAYTGIMIWSEEKNAKLFTATTTITYPHLHVRGKEVAERRYLSATSLPPLFGQAFRVFEQHVNKFGNVLLELPCRPASMS